MRFCRYVQGKGTLANSEYSYKMQQLESTLFAMVKTIFRAEIFRNLENLTFDLF